MTIVRQIVSRHNDLFKALRRLASEPAAYRRQGQVWLEGDHLCRALLARGGTPRRAVLTESAWADSTLNALACRAQEVIRVPDTAMSELSGLESPPPIAYVVDANFNAVLQPRQRTVVLDRVQDPGNVGSILRSASAMGFGQVLALKGTAALWSTKVLRAAMGAHFGLVLVEGGTLADLTQLGLPVAGALLRDAVWLHQTVLPDPLAWVFGHEGQGLAADVVSACALRVRIAQPGGEESLNVAAAAAICLHESARAWALI